jgi:hypothetical protein
MTVSAFLAAIRSEKIAKYNNNAQKNMYLAKPLDTPKVQNITLFLSSTKEQSKNDKSVDWMLLLSF